MKHRIYILLAFSIAILIGCTKSTSQSDSDDQQYSDVEVNFGVVPNWGDSKASTRGVEKESFESGDSFGVYAYTTAYGGTLDFSTSSTPDFMVDQEVSYDGSIWSYEPVKCWPDLDINGSSVSFFSYFPHSSKESGNVIIPSSSAASIEYTAAEDVAEQLDFMTANAINKTYFNSLESGIEFDFDHQLTQIRFSAAHNCGLNASVKILSITLRAKQNAVGSFAEDGSFTWGAYDSSQDDIDYEISVDDHQIRDTEVEYYATSSEYTDLMSYDVTTGVMMIPKNAIGDETEVTVTYTYQGNASSESELTETISFDTSSGITTGGGARFVFIIDVVKSDIGHLTVGDVYAEGWEEIVFEDYVL